MSVATSPGEPVLPHARYHALVLAAGEAIGRLLAFGAVVHVTRTVTPDAWGIVAVAASVTMYLGKIADFSIDTIGVDEVAKRPHEAGRLASALLDFRLKVAAGLAAVGGGWAMAALDGLERDTFALYFLTLIPVAASTRWVHLGFEHARPVVLWRVVADAVTLTTVVLTIRAPGDVWKFPLAVLAGDALNVSMLAVLVVARGHRLTVRKDWAIAWPVLRRALPMTAQILLGLVIYNADLLFLRALWTTADAGLYAAAFAVISFISNLSIAYATGAMPALSRSSSLAPDFQGVFDGVLLRGLLFALPVTVGGVLVATDLMVGVYGSSYSASGPLLQTLLISVPFSTIRLIWLVAFVALHHHEYLLRGTIYAAACNTALNVVLISRFGAIGAAWSTVLTDVLLSGLLWAYATRRSMSMPSINRLARPVAACVLMAIVLVACRSCHWPLRIGAGAATYSLVLLATGVIKYNRGGVWVDV